MSKFKIHLVVALAAIILATIGARMDSKLAAADTGPIVTIGGPIPLPVTGNVGITGTPNVNIANTPAVKLSGAADVANTAAAPLFIVNQDSPGRIGYESVVTQQCLSGGLCTFSFGSVPQGHRIAIQHVSGHIGMAPVSPSTAALWLGTNGIVSPFSVFTVTAAPGFLDQFFDQPVLAYFDSEQNIQLTVSASFNPAQDSIALSGYDLDCTTVPCNALNFPH